MLNNYFENKLNVQCFQTLHSNKLKNEKKKNIERNARNAQKLNDLLLNQLKFVNVVHDNYVVNVYVMHSFPWENVITVKTLWLMFAVRHIL